MYQFIPLHLCDYLNKILLKTSLETTQANFV